VVYGLAKSSFADRAGRRQDYFLGSGGVMGLLSALTGRAPPGSGPAVAQRSALHRGPVVFALPARVLREARRGAAAGDHALRQLELDMFRVAALYVVERTKGDVGAELAEAHRRCGAAGARRRPRGGGQAEGAPLGEFDLDACVAGGEGGHRKARGGGGAAGFACRVLAELRRQLRDAELARLAPGAQHAQRGHVVLMQGSLRREGDGLDEEGPCGQPALFDAPAVLPWVWPHLEALQMRPGLGGVAAPPRVWYRAGEEGAVLLACGELGSSEASSDAGAESPALGGSATLLPFAALQEAAPPGEGEGERAQGGRLRHVGSRRLPLSASTLRMAAMAAGPQA
jgi:hypothetical protein